MPHVEVTVVFTGREGGLGGRRVAASRAAVGTRELEPLHSVCGLCSLFPERNGCSGLDALVGLRLGEELELRVLAVLSG